MLCFPLNKHIGGAEGSCHTFEKKTVQSQLFRLMSETFMRVVACPSLMPHQNLFSYLFQPAASSRRDQQFRTTSRTYNLPQHHWQPNSTPLEPFPTETIKLASSLQLRPCQHQVGHLPCN